MSLYKIEKRFGTIAVKNGFITENQLIEAQTIQLREDLAGKPHRLVGQILKDAGHMDIAEVKQVLLDMQFPTEFCLRHVEVAHGLDSRGDLA